MIIPICTTALCMILNQITLYPLPVKQQPAIVKQKEGDGIFYCMAIGCPVPPTPPVNEKKEAKKEIRKQIKKQIKKAVKCTKVHGRLICKK